MICSDLGEILRLSVCCTLGVWEGEASLTCTCCASSLVGVRISTWEERKEGGKERGDGGEERREEGGEGGKEEGREEREGGRRGRRGREEGSRGEGGREGRTEKWISQLL